MTNTSSSMQSSKKSRITAGDIGREVDKCVRFGIRAT
jgi:hypothetical protein